MATFFLMMDSPIGILKLTSDEFQLKSISFDGEVALDTPFIPEILLHVKKQLQEYFDGIRQHFDVPLGPDGSTFQHQVWDQLTNVPYGSTKSYIDIARALGSESSSRAVGMANGRNPIPILIPCHRIIGHNGKLTGYAGGLERKKWLLIHEQQYVRKDHLF